MIAARMGRSRSRPGRDQRIPEPGQACLKLFAGALDHAAANRKALFPHFQVLHAAVVVLKVTGFASQMVCAVRKFLSECAEVVSQPFSMPLEQRCFMLTQPAMGRRRTCPMQDIRRLSEVEFGMIPIHDLTTGEELVGGQIPDPSGPITQHHGFRRVPPVASARFGPQRLTKDRGGHPSARQMYCRPRAPAARVAPCAIPAWTTPRSQRHCRLSVLSSLPHADAPSRHPSLRPNRGRAGPNWRRGALPRPLGSAGPRPPPAATHC